MDAAWFASWDRLSKHIHGRDRNSIIHRLLKRGLASPRAKFIWITPTEAGQLKREIGFVVKCLGDMPLKIR